LERAHGGSEGSHPDPIGSEPPAAFGAAGTLRRFTSLAAPQDGQAGVSP